MKNIKPSKNKEQWPRHAVNNIETRKRDLIVRIADWTRDKDEPGYDVEIYVAGVYDWNLSKGFSSRDKTRKQAKTEASAFAAKQISELL